MCLYVGSEVILANLLVYNKAYSSVGAKDIIKYCEILKNEIVKIKSSGTEYMYFNVTQQSIDDAINRYKSEFRKFGDEVYINNEIELSYFNARYSSEIVEILKRTAENYQ